MTVARILDEKGRDTVTIDPARSLAEAVEVLNRHRIGAVVVVDAAGAVQGILSERDVVRAIGERGIGALEAAVQDRMTRNVVTCASQTGLPELMGIMTAGKFRHVPIVEDGRLGGMVSIGDIVKFRLAEMEAEHKALRDYIATA